MVLQPEFIRNRQLWRQRHWIRRWFVHSFRNFWMNTIKISRPTVVLQVWWSGKIRLYAARQRKSGDRMSWSMSHRHNKNPFEWIAQTGFAMLFICRTLRIKEAACQTGKSESEFLQLLLVQDQNYPLSICEGHRSYCRSHRWSRKIFPLLYVCRVWHWR